MHLTSLLTADLETFDIEAWLRDMETRESLQEDQAAATWQNFFDEITALCH
jgi:hypothetical protein